MYHMKGLVDNGFFLNILGRKERVLDISNVIIAAKIGCLLMPKGIINKHANTVKDTSFQFICGKIHLKKKMIRKNNCKIKINHIGKIYARRAN